MIDYEKSRETALRVCKKLFDVRCISVPKSLNKAGLCDISYFLGLQVLDLCANSECFLDDFEHLLETSDGTPKSHKERGLL